MVTIDKFQRYTILITFDFVKTTRFCCFNRNTSLWLSFDVNDNKNNETSFVLRTTVYLSVLLRVPVHGPRKNYIGPRGERVTSSASRRDKLTIVSEPVGNSKNGGVTRVPLMTAAGGFVFFPSRWYQFFTLVFFFREVFFFRSLIL